ncbi:MAG TPA: hypothetical protein VK386_09265 [Acidimicrobiales bacterium]|nr:hypothetical protein [Acidimicrobiales bacterium]
MSASTPSATGVGHRRGPERLTGSAALRLHLALTVGLLASAIAFAIEVVRALHGNTLSWVYVVEWPLLAGFGTYMWWCLFTGRDWRSHGTPGAPAHEAIPDEKLEAWNRYLNQLEAGEGDE